MANIRLNKQTKTIKVVNRKDTIRLEREQPRVTLQHVGKVGPKGDAGKALPTGGTTGYVLAKASDKDFDYQWVPTTLTDKNYITYFSGQSYILVEHGLAKYPAVTVIDSAGTEVAAAVDYIDNNNIAVSFSYPTSGRITCN